MKSIFTAISFFALVILFAVPSKTFAQTPDTVWVAATPVGNINNFIKGDTTSTGSRVNENRVYKLYRDSIYFFTGILNVNFPLTLISGSGTGALPVIEPAILSDNSRPKTFINLISGGLTLKQIYLFGLAPDEIPVRPGKAIIVSGDSMKIKADSCLFDGWSFGAFSAGGKMNSYWITNNIFRNMMDYTSWAYGDSWISLSNIPTDTVYIVNNTMFCDEGYTFAAIYYNKYLVFNHNTIFLSGKQPLSISVLTNGVLTNNIFYGVGSEGEGISIIGLGSLGKVGTDYGITPAQRQIKVDNNAYFTPQAITNLWKSINDTATSHQDSVFAPLWMSNGVAGMFHDTTFLAVTTRLVADTTIHGADTIVTANITVDTTFIHAADTTFAADTMFFAHSSISGDTTFIADTTVISDKIKTTKWYPDLEESGNVNTDPGFSSPILSAADSLAHYVYLTKSGGLGTYLWHFNPTGSLYPPTQPVPENLAYSNTAMQHAGTDGFALGDLNWFPDQHNQWSRLVTNVKKEEGSTPTEYSLDQNYPNPFNPSTVISYSIQKEGNVELEIFNILGQKVSTLVDQVQAAGRYKVSFNANVLSSGVYFYSLRTGNFIQIKKMLLLK